MAFTFTRSDIDRLCPRPKSGTKAKIWDDYADALVSMVDEINAAGINTPLIGAHAFAQWGAESQFTLMWESGNYSADRIMAIFGEGKHSANVTSKEAAKMAALPTANDERAKALFERVYGLGNPKKAKELGNTQPGDGYRYRGLGPEQITGGMDHKRFGLDKDQSPKSVIRAALMEWKEKGCSAKAAADDCKGVTRLINGGCNGLQERQALLRQAKTIWLDNVDDVPVPVVAAALDKKETRPLMLAAKSPTVWSLVAAGWASLTNGVQWVFGTIEHLFGSLGDIQADVSSVVDPVTSLLGSFKIDASDVAAIATTLTIAALAIAVVRHVSDKQPEPETDA